MTVKRIWKICKVCGEYKKHRAHGMCQNCYLKEYRRIKTWKICIICGEYKKHFVDGMCKLCYYKKYPKRPINKKSAVYLGCTIAEKVLSKVFKDVEIMPYGNSGFDFTCNKGKKIDVKSSCIRKNQRNWVFNIKKNVVADFFLCIAFNDRESLTPLHLWLIPSNEVKDKRALSISLGTIHKWDKLKLDISKTLQCCDEMRG